LKKFFSPEKKIDKVSNSLNISGFELILEYTFFWIFFLVVKIIVEWKK